MISVTWLHIAWIGTLFRKIVKFRKKNCNHVIWWPCYDAIATKFFRNSKILPFSRIKSESNHCFLLDLGASRRHTMTLSKYLYSGLRLQSYLFQHVIPKLSFWPVNLIWFWLFLTKSTIWEKNMVCCKIRIQKD